MPLRIQGALRILNHILPIFRAVQAGSPGRGLERDTSLKKVMQPPATSCAAICNVTKVDPTCHGDEVLDLANCSATIFCYARAR